jgi:hypothetical protein
MTNSLGNVPAAQTALKTITSERPTKAWTGHKPFPISPGLTAVRRVAQVAQLVEQRIENPRVAGSIPALGTISPYLSPGVMAFSLFRMSSAAQSRRI